MGMLRYGNSQAVICLDIGRESVKLIKGTKKEGKICVLDFACRSYPSEDTTPDSIGRHIHELVSAVSSVKEAKKFKVNVIVPSRKLCIRVITMPVIPQEELYEAVKSKIRKYISEDFEKMIFSFNILGQVQKKGLDQFEVAFVALPRSVLDAYLQFFDFMRISPNIITPVCFSGWSLIRETGLYQELNSVMIINIEHQETDLTVYRQGRLIFTRNIPAGAKKFIDILKSQTRFSLTDPADIKLLWDFDAKGPDVQPAEESPLMNIKDQLCSETKLLSQEIELTAHHYYQIAHGQKIDKCIILGSITQVGGLVDFLKKKLEIPIEVLSIPDDKLEFPADKKGGSQWDLPLYAQALGALCMGPNDINLLSQIKPEGRQIKQVFQLPQLLQSLSRTALAAVLFISSALVIVTTLQGMHFYYKKKIKSYTVKQDQLRGRSVQLMQMRKKMDKLDFVRNFYAQLINERPSYPAIIGEIRKALPEERIVVDALKFHEGRDRRSSAKTARSIKFNVTGRIMGEDVTETEVTEFTLALEQSGFFENISVSLKGKTALEGNVVDYKQKSHFGDGELSGRKLSELPFEIDGTLQKNWSAVN